MTTFKAPPGKKRIIQFEDLRKYLQSNLYRQEVINSAVKRYYFKHATVTETIGWDGKAIYFEEVFNHEAGC